MTRLLHDPHLPRDLPRDLPPDLPHRLPQRPPPARRAVSAPSGRRHPGRDTTRPSPASRWPAVLGLAAAALLGAAVPVGAAAQGADRADGTVLFLVRHAEKEAEPAADPPLNDEGRARAELLATLLADAGLDAVWSTDYERTRATAAPLAAGEGVDVELYDPRDLAGFAATLTGRGGRALVVGHSNTTPALVELLGGDPGPPIDEPAEYDRLYVVTLTSDGPVTTVLRFGRPFRGG